MTLLVTKKLSCYIQLIINYANFDASFSLCVLL